MLLEILTFIPPFALGLALFLATALYAAFIFSNSCSGIAGFMLKGNAIPSQAWILLPVVLAGASLGSLWESRRARIPALQRAQPPCWWLPPPNS